MIQIVLLLFGVEFVRTKAKYLMLIGILWGVLGVSIFIDGLDGVTYFPLRVFGTLLLVESLITLEHKRLSFISKGLFFAPYLFSFCLIGPTAIFYWLLFLVLRSS